MDRKKIFEEIIGVTKVVAPAVVTQQVYSRMFNHHFLTFKPFYFEASDFTNLERKRYTFSSCNKHKLVGYIYQDKNVDKHGIFVFSHGYGGGGQRTYMDCTNYLCSHGYYVFARSAGRYDYGHINTYSAFFDEFCCSFVGHGCAVVCYSWIKRITFCNF